MGTFTIQSEDGGTFNAYIAMPETLPAPCVVVIQEIFGVNYGMRAKCDWLASQGYIAVCPDLFWRIEPGIELTDKTEDEWKRAFELFNMFDVDKGIDDLITTVNTMSEHENTTDKVGCMGYCLGGKLAYLLGCRSDIDASVGYYGVGLDELLDEANNLEGRILLHMAEEDEYVNKDSQAKIKAGLTDNSNIEIYSYAGVNHAFSRHDGQNYHAESAALADGRTLEFLAKNLKD